MFIKLASSNAMGLRDCSKAACLFCDLVFSLDVALFVMLMLMHRLATLSPIQHGARVDLVHVDMVR